MSMARWRGEGRKEEGVGGGGQLQYILSYSSHESNGPGRQVAHRLARSVGVAKGLSPGSKLA